MRNCKICGRYCEAGTIRAGMCPKHYVQTKRFGKVLDDNPRTCNDLNEFIVLKNHVEMLLYDKAGNETVRALIDFEDMEKLKNIKWHLASEYIINKKHGKMHRYIMNCKDEFIIIDHINRNVLDNRKSNLRECTKSENSRNRTTQSNNKTGITGVSKDKDLFVAYISYEGKRIFLGRFKNIDDAIKIRKEAEKKYFKEFIPL